MARIADGIEELVGNTPLMQIRSLSEATGCQVIDRLAAWVLDETAFTHCYVVIPSAPIKIRPQDVRSSYSRWKMLCGDMPGLEGVDEQRELALINQI